MLVPHDHRVTDRGRDVPADPDIQRQAPPAEASAGLLAPQEQGQPARAGQQGDGFPDDRLLTHRVSEWPRHRRA